MRRVTRTPYRRGVTLHADASPGEVESADIAFPLTGTNREQLALLMERYDKGLTMFEAAELLGWHGRNNVNPRMQELKREELVYKTGETRATGEGGRADVWRHTRFLTATDRAALPAPVSDVPIPRGVPAPLPHTRSDGTVRTRGASSTRRGTTVDHESLQRRLAKTRAKKAAGATGSS